MQINSNVLKKFLSKICMSGTAQVKDCILDFSKTGLSVTSVACANTVLVSATLDKKAFEDYEELGKLGIESLTNIIQYSEKFNGNMDLKKKENVLLLKGGKRKVEVLLKDLEYIEQPPEYPVDLEKKYTSKFTVKIEDLKSFLDDVHLVGGSEIKIETKKDRLILYSKNLDTIEEQVDVKVTGEQKVCVGIPFIDAVKNLSGEVTVNLEEKHPVLVINTDETSTVKIIVAPLEM